MNKRVKTLYLKSRPAFLRSSGVSGITSKPDIHYKIAIGKHCEPLIGQAAQVPLVVPGVRLAFAEEAVPDLCPVTRF
jgi:hypothetical protein